MHDEVRHSDPIRQWAIIKKRSAGVGGGEINGSKAFDWLADLTEWRRLKTNL